MILQIFGGLEQSVDFCPGRFERAVVEANGPLPPEFIEQTDPFSTVFDSLGETLESNDMMPAS
ncbi:MAG TPA: hypothetical protein VJ904_00600 [Tichowtungia sp.]|nr:hypothetical protein [Tichowtungia sp.]